MGATRYCTLCAVFLSAKPLQQSPENVSRTARADLFSLHSEISLLLAESAAASFKRVHLIAVVIAIWTASMRIYMLFVSTKELVLGALCARTAACTRTRRSILRRPSAIMPLVVATRCSVLAAYGGTIGN